MIELIIILGLIFFPILLFFKFQILSNDKPILREISKYEYQKIP